MHDSKWKGAVSELLYIQNKWLNDLDGYYPRVPLTKVAKLCASILKASCMHTLIYTSVFMEKD